MLAQTYVRQCLESAGGSIAGLLISRQVGWANAIVPEGGEPADVGALTAFEIGKRWQQSACDAKLEAFVGERLSGEWWAFCQNAWSQCGDLNEAQRLGDHVFFQGQYLHLCRETRQLALHEWRSNAVSFAKLIFFCFPASLSLLPTRAGHLSNTQGDQLSRSIFATAVSAYDDESWVIASLET
jgi:hypothetical protein